MSKPHQIQNHQLNQQWHTVLGYKETLKVKTVGPQSAMHLFLVCNHVTSAGGTPYVGLYGEAPPEMGIFFRLQAYKRVGISLVEVYKMVGKSVIWVCERAQKG